MKSKEAPKLLTDEHHKGHTRYASMNRLLPLLCILILSASALSAQVMRQHLWRDRVLLVFAPELTNASFEQQALILQGEYAEELQERRVVVYRVTPGQTIQPSGAFMREARTEQLYLHYDVREEDFTVILLGLDGQVKLRQLTPVSTATLFATIDRMPMRQTEVKSGGRP